MGLLGSSSPDLGKPENAPEITAFLKEIADALLVQMRAEKNWQQIVNMETKHVYRGKWTRIRIKDEILENWRDNALLDIDAMAVEIIIVDEGVDMKDEIHHHDGAHAYIVILGSDEGFDEPDGEFFLGSDMPIFAHSGITLDVHSGEIHGFSAPGKAKLAFLSVQSKHIDKDYHLLRGTNRIIQWILERFRILTRR